ncbi:carbohydrate sulfotransferase 9-like [Mizuhopecten yessoensis]|uniref:Carbohydrate sulfotransferase n=1 Tax=Mizuhopecten yessoensis TaxID=6573 RepID=A0A210R463_MIZYE|nr:carbohydrate sulfotransferase 9-like [Mizuhopecten yessoensis]OWF55797.1 Carbohydrate sulfotransferase 8 [Mizuhopecten yessoensis]
MRGFRITLRTTLGISFLVLIWLVVLHVGNFLSRPDRLRRMPHWSNFGRTGERMVVDEPLLNTATEPPLILGRNFHHMQYGLSEEHEKRRNTIERVCDKSTHGYYGRSDGSKLAKKLVIDHRHRIVYCAVQKTGSTFLRSLLGIVKTSEKSDLDSRWIHNKRKNMTDLTNFHYILTKSCKMMFTRDPYQRLFSGYVDKLFTVNTMYWKTTGTYIKNKLLNRDQEPQTHCGHGITFPQFINYIIESEKTGVHTDPHFTPIYEHCRPCQISYDFIGKMETFTNDSLTLLNAWNKLYGINVTYDDFEAETALSRAIGHTGRLYNMRNGLEKCISFYSGMQRIWKDLQIRGILTKRAKLPFTESEANNVNRTQLVDILTKAIQKSSMDRTALRQQQTEAMIQAYRQVPVKDLLRLREVVRPDCELFGYEVAPNYIFNRRDSSHKLSSFKYFKIDE